MTNYPGRRSVGILDVGLGNVGSITRMITKVGGKAVIVKTPSMLQEISKLVLPGVGHFDHGIGQLRDYGFAEILCDFAAQKNRFLLGICLGMQLLCRRSEEGVLRGLGLIAADVIKFDGTAGEGIKIPHMGWNIVTPSRRNPLIEMDSQERRFYFVHSFKVIPDCKSISIGATFYGGEFCSAFQSENIFGVQFHPEKSHRYGISLLKNFVEL